MGLLDSSTLTVNAMLTTRGRELLSNEGSVSIMAYNVMGQMVSTLHDGNMSAGSHTIAWDASSLASGMYIIKAEVAGNVISKKVMLLK